MATAGPTILSAASLPSTIHIGPSPHPTAGTNDVAASFWSDCLTFSSAAIATISITVLSLISDWLLLQVLQSLQVPGSETPPKAEDSDLAFFIRPNPIKTLHIILIVSTAVYICYFLWFVYMFSIQRKLLKDRWDGLPSKTSCVVRYGGEICILLNALVQDVPVSAVLFGIQAASSCQLILCTESVIFLLATCSTLVSVVWKAVQVIWNAGCLGYRWEYLTSRGLLALRCSTILVLGAAFALVTCNLILLSGWKGSIGGQGWVMDKVQVDRWWRQDRLLMVSTEGYTNISQSATITSVRSILDPYNPHQVFTIPCKDSTYDFTSFLESSHQDLDYTNCTAVFTFNIQPQYMRIIFDYRYTLYLKNNTCRTGNFQNYEPIEVQPERLKSGRVPLMADSKESSEEQSNDIEFYTSRSSILTNMYARTESYHSVVLESYSWPHTVFSCKYTLSRNNTLLEQLAVCAA